MDAGTWAVHKVVPSGAFKRFVGAFKETRQLPLNADEFLDEVRGTLSTKEMGIELKLAVDTNALCALLNGETAAEAVAEVLQQQQRQGSLVICRQVYGELLAMYPENELLSFLNETGIMIDLTMSAEPWPVAAAATV